MELTKKSMKQSSNALAVAVGTSGTTDLIYGSGGRAERSEVVLKIHQIALADRQVQIGDLVQQTGLNEHSVRSEVERLVKRGSLISCKHPRDRRRRIYKLTSDMAHIRDMQKRIQAFQLKLMVKLLPTSTAFVQFQRTCQTIHDYEPGTLKREHLVDSAFQQLRTVELDEGGAAASEPLQAFLYFKRLQLEFFTGRKNDSKLAWRLGELRKVLEEAGSSAVTEVRDFHFGVLFNQYIAQWSEYGQKDNRRHLIRHDQVTMQAAMMAAREVGGAIESSPAFLLCRYSFPAQLEQASRKTLEDLQIPVEETLQNRVVRDELVRESIKAGTTLTENGDKPADSSELKLHSPPWYSRSTLGITRNAVSDSMLKNSQTPESSLTLPLHEIRTIIDQSRRNRPYPIACEE